jgi:uncharacterized repeat protein (TIGR03803 family)
MINRSGGVNYYGVISKFDTLTAACDMIYESNGYGSVGSNEFYEAANGELIETSNGMLYGTTPLGGLHNRGCLFKIAKNGTGYQTIYSFDSGIEDIGFNPNTGFIEKDGFLYGTCAGEGYSQFNSGTILKIDLTNDEVTFPHVLSGIGSYPVGTLVESTNGKFYMTCHSGGPTLGGAILELDILGNTVRASHSFNASNSINGNGPESDKLALVDFNLLNTKENVKSNIKVDIFPNPSNGKFTVNLNEKIKFVNVKVISLTGEIMYEEGSNSVGSLSIEQDLVPGVYFLVIETQEGIFYSKLINK